MSFEEIAHIYLFAIESNTIENIHDNVRHIIHKKALEHFLLYDKITLDNLEEFVKLIEPNARLRRNPEDLVSIGGKLAPPPILSFSLLKDLLEDLNANKESPYILHCRYEKIHPFMDGNGRSGRALWFWQMIKFYHYTGSLKFLQMFYYQTLQHFSTLGRM